MRESPPKLSKPRAADSLRSGTIDLRLFTKTMVRTAQYEAVRIFGGKPGNYWTAEASRKYAYAKKGTSGTCHLGRVDNRVVPRMYFSQQILEETESPLPMNVVQRWDYDARFPLGYGPMAMDEDNRIIQKWSTEMQMMADRIWNEMQQDKRYKRLCRPGNEFNHCSVHLYRSNARMRRHRDRTNNAHNSMKENTAVAVFTIGDDRELHFSRTYDDEKGRTIMEPNDCYKFNQHEGCLFVLDPADEQPKTRRDHGGRRRKNAAFAHGVACGSDKDYLSIAFVFRCLDAKAFVNSATDRVIPPPPKDEKEKQRRLERALVRKEDNKPNSQLKREVRELQDQWRKLMENKKWL